MRTVITTLLAAVALQAALTATPARAEPRGYYEVVGVEDDDMLKMRVGPGVGYKIVVGLPNGTVLLVQGCERSGNTSWCKVALKQARGLKGYVSSAYLRKM
ncbi:SH3 domain-containing protein [Pseudogemmobacter blasticus]|uniref:Peptide-binding protein n=1 Tax=Fuscovulum blasticum DSM 2131 TaxID=1188250 RepID=A0A2T4J743_FUSBL|nr:SH3 domain-containing protein [Fuscovulum blasticum]AWD21716.1 peptide-binding protein [Fuscovulum blasticum]PTE13724.1 peptide-binding protein [Fuscovulum blasticum DSM 2131]